jgi:hypothetical protein
VKYQDQEAVVSIIDGQLLDGTLKINKMNPRVTNVEPSTNFKLLITFSNGEVKNFDMKPYLGIGLFKELQDHSVFHSVRPFLGSIQWSNGVDLCPDTLYLDSKKLGGVTSNTYFTFILNDHA